MGSRLGKLCETKESTPWLDYPDGKWSPRPRLPSDCEVYYEVDGYCLEAELDQKKRWKASRSPTRSSVEIDVQVSPAHRTIGTDFTIELQCMDGFERWTGTRSLEDLQRMHHALEQEATPPPAAPPLLLTPLRAPPELWGHQARETCTALQRWIREIIDTELVHSNAFQDFLQDSAFSSSSSSSASDGEWEQASRVVLTLPLLSEILEFLDQPEDVVIVCHTVSRLISDSSATICARQWERMYRQRWPAFFAAQSYMSKAKGGVALNWQAMYRHTHTGKCEEVLEVFDREKKLGFAMSCMIAKVTWNERSNAYVANYISASQVLPESIPASEGHRLRFCPRSAWAWLQPELAPPQVSDLYPFRVLKGGLEELKVGQGVELQWKMQMGSPFGWWYGTLESIEHNNDETANVTMVFGHFPATSRWYRLQVTVGDGMMRRCAIGGHHGGIRGVSTEERKQWMKFFPTEPVVF